MNKRTYKQFVMVYDKKAKRHVQAQVQLSYDLDELAQYLGQRALENKSQRSAEIGGRMVCKVTL